MQESSQDCPHEKSAEKISGINPGHVQNDILVPFFGDFSIGLLSPIHSLRFLSNNKSILFIGLAPQLLGLVFFGWISVQYLLPFVTDFALGAFPTSWQTGVLSLFVNAVTGVLLLLIYGLIYVPLLGALASPLYDFVAAKTYETSTGRKLPQQDLKDMVRSIGSEFSKLGIYFLLLAVTFFVPILSPFFLVFSIWYLGWDILDRTLILTNMSLGKRAAFGFKHPLACLTLGVWSYIPLVGGLFGFAFAAAGALVVGRLSTFSPFDSKNQSAIK